MFNIHKPRSVLDKKAGAFQGRCTYHRVCNVHKKGDAILLQHTPALLLHKLPKKGNTNEGSLKKLSPDIVTPESECCNKMEDGYEWLKIT